MTTKLKFKQHLRAAINILLPFSENDRSYMAFLAVVAPIGIGVAMIITWSTETALEFLSVILWLAAVYAVFHVYAFLNILVLLNRGPTSFWENFAGFWRSLAERKFAFEGFWRRRRRRQELKAAGYSREMRHYLVSRSE